MRLRYRMWLFMGVTLVCLVGGISLLISSYLIGSYKDLERQNATRNVERAGLAFAQVTNDLHEKTLDWSSWDDSYKFMSDHNDAYVKSNLIDASILSLRVDVILYVDTSGRLFHAKTAHRLKNLAPPSPERLLAALGLDKPRSELTSLPGGFNGTIVQPSGLLMVSVRPILTTQNTGPARGFLVFGRYFDSGELQKLAARTRQHVQMYSLADRDLSKDCRQAIGALSAAAPVLVAPLDGKTIAGYTLIRDVHGKPVFLLKIAASRDIYIQGLKSMRNLMQLVLMVAVVFSGVILLVMEKSVLARLSKLTRQVERIGDERHPLTRVDLPGGDELAQLAGKTNGMLAKLEQSARQIRESEEKLRIYNENLEQIVLERTQQLELQNLEVQQMNAILENAVEGISQFDVDGRYVMTNQSYANTLGYRLDEMIGISWKETVHPADQAKMIKAFKVLLEKGKAELEVCGVKRDGSTFYKQVVMIAAHSENGEFTGHYCFMKDISERKVLEAQIEHQAFHDTLTDLPNRALFMNRLYVAQVRAHRQNASVAVLYLDIDNLKTVNDSLGHEAGDQLLQAVAKRIQHCVRPGDTVARLGGDEFTVLLETTVDEKEALKIAERIVSQMRAPIKLANCEVFASASIGVAYSTVLPDQPDRLLREADTAMYHAKMHGKAGYVLFTSSMNDRIVERIQIESALRQALDREEICVYYQPLIHLETGDMSGVEALARWDRPGHGLVLPGKFIPIAEETGLIVPIGYRVMEEACRQTKAWKEAHKEYGQFTVNVNMSGKQLQCPDVVERVLEVLRKTGIDPGDLKIEVTESVMMANVADAADKLRQLKALGVKLALDDFGTGYSSMAILNEFPLDTVKIDRAFIKRLEDQPEAVSIVGAIVMLSKAMSLDVTAEGIEAENQVIFLKELGCDTGQGYLFGKPMAAESITKLMASGPTPFSKSIGVEERQSVEQMLRAA